MFQSFLGGILIGLAAALLLILNGRIMGLSGILAGILRPPRSHERGWRAAFLGGLLLCVALTSAVNDELAPAVPKHPVWLVALAGALVGFGSRMGLGCTSGHGICGIGRGSGRSVKSVLVFMSVAALVATLMGVAKQ